MMKSTVILCVALVAGGCLRWPGPAGPSEVVKLYGGQDGYELVRVPALANVQRYSVAARQMPRDADRAAIGNAVIVDGPVRPDDATIKALSDVLCRKETYAFDTAKGCIFKPDVAVRFAGARRTLDVVFCFSCKQVTVFEGDKRIGGAEFDPGAAQLAALLKPAGKVQ
jgi:hypothetical protein